MLWHLSLSQGCCLSLRVCGTSPGMDLQMEGAQRSYSGLAHTTNHGRTLTKVKLYILYLHICIYVCGFVQYLILHFIIISCIQIRGLPLVMFLGQIFSRPIGGILSSQALLH